MNDWKPQELISGMLDGELTPDEQAQADELVAASDDARALLEDLRSLRTTLQAMPRRRVGEDLSAKVLRQAEREMLVRSENQVNVPATAAAAGNGQALQSAPPVDAPPVDPPGSSTQDEAPARPVVRLPIGRSLRSWAWAAAAMAAAVALYVTNLPDQPARDELAKSPAAAGDGAVMTSAEQPANGLAAADAPAGTLGTSIGESASDKSVDDVASVDGLARRALRDAAKPGEPTAGFKHGRFAAKGGVEMRNSALAAGRQQAQQEELSERSLDARLAQKGAEVARAEASVRQSLEGGQGFGVAGGEIVDRRAILSQVDQLGVDGEAATRDLLVVRVDVSPEAVRSGAFDNLLARQQIAWEEPASQDAERDFFHAEKAIRATEAQGQRRAAKAESEQKPLADSKADKPPASERSANKSPANELAGNKQREANQAPASNQHWDAQQGLDLVLVEASPAQIRGTLAGLAAAPSSFVAVRVEPAPGVKSQAPLAAYSRSAELQLKRGLSKEAEQLNRDGQSPLSAATKQTAEAKRDNDNKPAPDAEPAVARNLKSKRKAQPARTPKAAAKPTRKNPKPTADNAPKAPAAPADTAPADAAPAETGPAETGPAETGPASQPALRKQGEQRDQTTYAGDRFDGPAALYGRARRLSAPDDADKLKLLNRGRTTDRTEAGERSRKYEQGKSANARTPVPAPAKAPDPAAGDAARSKTLQNRPSAPKPAEKPSGEGGGKAAPGQSSAQQKKFADRPPLDRAAMRVLFVFRMAPAANTPTGSTPAAAQAAPPSNAAEKGR